MENQGVKIDKFAISTLLSSKNVAKTELVELIYTNNGTTSVQPLCFCNGNGEELTSLKGKNVLIIVNIIDNFQFLLVRF